MSRVSRVRYMIDPDALRSQSAGEFLTDVLLSMAATSSTTGPNGPCVLGFYGANALRDHQWQGNQWVVRILSGVTWLSKTSSRKSIFPPCERPHTLSARVLTLCGMETADMKIMSGAKGSSAGSPRRQLSYVAISQFVAADRRPIASKRSCYRTVGDGP
jgi:hypothetical protein